MTTETQTRTIVPRKLSQGMIEALSVAIANGNYAVTACRLCGIAESTFYFWIKQGETDIEEGRETIHASLIESLKKAEAEAEDLMIQTARNAAVEKRDGYLAITVNERRHPERWGRRDRTTVDINETKSIQITQVTEVRKAGEVVEGELVKGLPEGDTDATE